MTLVQQLVDLGMRPCLVDYEVGEIDPTKLRVLATPTDRAYYCRVDCSGAIVDVYAKDEVFWRKSK